MTDEEMLEEARNRGEYVSSTRDKNGQPLFGKVCFFGGVTTVGFVEVYARRHQTMVYEDGMYLPRYYWDKGFSLKVSGDWGNGGAGGPLSSLEFISPEEYIVNLLYNAVVNSGVK